MTSNVRTDRPTGDKFRSLTILVVWGAFLISLGLIALSAFFLDYDWLLLTGFASAVVFFVLGVWLGAKWRHLESYRT